MKYNQVCYVSCPHYGPLQSVFSHICLLRQFIPVRRAKENARETGNCTNSTYKTHRHRVKLRRSSWATPLRSQTVLFFFFFSYPNGIVNCPTRDGISKFLQESIFFCLLQLYKSSVNRNHIQYVRIPCA